MKKKNRKTNNHRGWWKREMREGRFVLTFLLCVSFHYKTSNNLIKISYRWFDPSSSSSSSSTSRVVSSSYSSFSHIYRCIDLNLSFVDPYSNLALWLVSEPISLNHGKLLRNGGIVPSERRQQQTKERKEEAKPFLDRLRSPPQRRRRRRSQTHRPIRSNRSRDRAEVHARSRARAWRVRRHVPLYGQRDRGGFGV